jgi:glutamine---fructose-6-phosphate transaminase (isomerizing)
MCGILGYVGPKNPVDVCIKGLSFLEYRGYDSSGVAGVHEQELLYCKEAGKVQNLEKAVATLKRLRNAIAHTRWATHGKPSKENAHPQFDQLHHIAVVHNGIIENHASLRATLEKQGVKFASETDSETIAHLVASHYEGSLLEAVQKTLKQLHGFWAIAVVHKDHPNLIIAAAKENPLAIGISSNLEEVYLSSDVNALDEPDLDILFLQSNEVAEISPKEVKVFDFSGALIHKATEKLSVERQSLSKNGFEHFMLKEIFEQPDTIRRALHGRCDLEKGTVFFEELENSSLELEKVEKILILACGTSWHAGCIAASWIEEQAKIPCQVEIASEHRYKIPVVSPNTLVLAISQSGETFDTIAAVQEMQLKGAKALAICNEKNSTLARRADSCILIKAGPEISVCSTKAFTSQLSVLSLFSIFIARGRGMKKEEGAALLEQLLEIPLHVEFILRNNETIKQLADKYAKYNDFFFLGRNYMYATALEGALKLKEISYLNATGYPAGEMKHGPIALVNENLVTIGLCGNHRTLDKTLSNLTEVKSRGANILAFAPVGTPQISDLADDVLWLPHTSDELSSITYSVAGQLLAYYIALNRGTDIDQPKNLAKSVTVE